jgi:hypothetical protein
MEKLPSKQVVAAVDKLAARIVKGDGATMARSSRSTVAEDGRVLHRIVSFNRADPNGARHVAIMDDSGREVASTALSDAVKAALGEAVLGLGSVRPVAAAGIGASIDPTSNDLVLELGETESEIVTVTIPPNAGVSKADVYLLADTTGSMGSIIEAVKAGANSILGANYGPIDIAFGVGNYKDFPETKPPFTHQLAPDTNAAAVTAAINAWAASGGGDIPEGQLFALNALAEAPGGTIGWRPDAKRIIVWFGDAPGHDPICAAMSGLGFDITEASATARLVGGGGGDGITVLAISTDTGTPGALNADPSVGAGDYSGACAIGGAPNQATRIAAATGGQHVSGINAAGIVDTIIDLIEAAVLAINEVKLVPTAAIAPFVEAISPTSYGPLSGKETHVLPFKVSWRGVKPCADEDAVFKGGLNAVADGVVIARKPVTITVPACPPEFVYAVKYVCGTSPDCGCAEGTVRPGRYATDINIHNPGRDTAAVSKLAIPLVTAGIGVGREPRAQNPVGADRIKLPAHAATMDDCRRLAELHYGAPPEGSLPLTIGFLEIVSTQQLVVTAVYTATGADGHLTMDVQTLQPITRPQRPPRSGGFEPVPPGGPFKG